MQLATVRFNVTPPEAQLYFDDAPLAMGTRSKVVPRDSGAHVLGAEAEGYRSARLEFVATGDKTIELVLEKRAVSKPLRAVVTRPRSKKTAAPPEKADNRVDCSNPFYIDAAGIKRVRSECR
jgi:hypothetical protein